MVGFPKSSQICTVAMHVHSSVHVGRILNRFSKDIGFVDAVLPYEFVDFLTVSNEQ